MASQLVDEVSTLSWYHRIDLGNGLVTPGRSSASPTVIRALDDIDFTGKRVLDVGCWDGLWTFESEKRGAAEVYAIDDVSQRSFHDTRTFRLAKEILRSNAYYFPETPLERVPELGIKFDIVLFLGVYYHLRDPLRALGLLRNVLNEGGIIVIEGPVSYSRRKSFATFLYNDISLRDHSNWWIPSIRCLEEWVESSFFRKKLIYTHTNDLFSRSGWSVHAARRVIARFAPRLYIRSYTGRAVIVAQTYSGQDSRWVFPDPMFAEVDGNTYG